MAQCSWSCSLSHGFHSVPPLSPQPSSEMDWTKMDSSALLPLVFAHSRAVLSVLARTESPCPCGSDLIQISFPHQMSSTSPVVHLTKVSPHHQPGRAASFSRALVYSYIDSHGHYVSRGKLMRLSCWSFYCTRDERVFYSPPGLFCYSS
jgi:hypothetical protein